MDFSKITNWFGRNIFSLLLIAIIIFFFLQHKKDMKEIKRQSNNLEVLNNNNGYAVKLLVGELKDYDNEIDSLRKSFGIKERNIKNIVAYKYNIKDTTVQSFVITHINKDTRAFKAELKSKHYNIFETVKDTTITIDSLIIKDKNTLFVYNSKPKWFWHFNKFWIKKKTTAQLYSEFKNDTIGIDRIYIYDK